MALNLPREVGKAIHIKLTARTELWEQVMICANHYGVSPTRAARMMMRGGFLGFQKVAKVNERRVQDESDG